MLRLHNVLGAHDGEFYTRRGFNLPLAHAAICSALDHHADHHVSTLRALRQQAPLLLQRRWVHGGP